MKSKILHNSSEKDILNYRIEQAELDQNENPIIDNTTGRNKWTGNTLEWSIRAGETAEFPAYVADYLKKIYPFLEEKKPKVEEGAVEPAKGQPSGSFVCKHCGKALKNKRGLGLHIGLKHTDEII